MRKALDSTLLPFPNIKGNHYNESNHYVEIRKYQLILKVDTLLFNNKIINKPDFGYFNIYEMFKEKFIIATPEDDETKYSSIGYALSKNYIKIISLDDLEKVYEANIEEKFIVDIDIENMWIDAYDPCKKEILKYKLKRIR